jgi:microsomal epoxide hydrolase
LYVVTPQYAEQAANLQKNRPGTEVEIFRNAGHALFVDEPERFNELIIKFAGSLSRP